MNNSDEMIKDFLVSNKITKCRTIYNKQDESIKTKSNSTPMRATYTKSERKKYKKKAKKNILR